MKGNLCGYVYKVSEKFRVAEPLDRHLLEVLWVQRVYPGMQYGRVSNTRVIIIKTEASDKATLYMSMK